MNLRKMFFRDKQEVSVDVYEAWEVRWSSRHGDFSGETRPEIRVFTSEKDAEEFAAALRDAFRLIKHSHGTYVAVEKQGN